MAGRVAGASAPAFVERSRTDVFVPGLGSVAGASAPAFVERATGTGGPYARPNSGVAGASAPAFVERACIALTVPFIAWVSPGHQPRPSLSDPRGRPR